MNFPKNYPFEDCKFWHFSGLAQFSVLTYFHYFGFFGIILSRSMRENSVILKISPFGYTSLSKSCIWSFCHFCPMHNFLLWLIWKIQLFLAILEKSLPENHASILFCHFGIHSSSFTSYRGFLEAQGYAFNLLRFRKRCLKQWKTSSRNILKPLKI